MASLREQKRLIKGIHDSDDLVLYDTPNETNIVEYFLKHPLFNEDSKINFSKPYWEENKNFWQPREERVHKIKALIRSCIHDKFIEPIKEEVERQEQVLSVDYYKIMSGTKEPPKTFKYIIDRGYQATSRGTDLLTVWGFVSITLEKYSPISLFLTGTGIAAVILGAIYWIFTQLPTWLCYVSYIPFVFKWCHA